MQLSNTLHFYSGPDWNYQLEFESEVCCGQFDAQTEIQAKA